MNRRDVFANNECSDCIEYSDGEGLGPILLADRAHRDFRRPSVA